MLFQSGLVGRAIIRRDVRGTHSGRLRGWVRLGAAGLVDSGQHMGRIAGDPAPARSEPIATSLRIGMSTAVQSGRGEYYDAPHALMKRWSGRLEANALTHAHERAGCARPRAARLSFESAEL